MAKRTLLELTQAALSAIDGDEVNSISDTVESLQVVAIIKECYYDLIDEFNLPTNADLINLEGQADTAKPTHMRIPENVSDISWVKYNVKLDVADDNQYRDIPWKNPKDFINLCNGRPSTDTTNYQVVMYNTNTPLVISKMNGPTCWTSFDDEYVVFDAYDADVDSTLQTSKVQAYGHIRGEFTSSDSYVPDLPENLFSFLSAMIESRCFAQLKQSLNPKSEQREGRMRVRAGRNKWRQQRMLEDGPNYGRK